MRAALVLSCHNTGLGVIRSLGIAGIPVVAVFYDKNDMGQVSRYCTERIMVPHPEREEQRFVKSLLALVPRYEGGVLFPCDDETLGAVSRNRGVLSPCYAISCQGWDVIRKVIQKQYTYELARHVGVPHPRTRLIHDVNEVDPNFLADVGFPCLVKPCESHLYSKKFGKKVAKVWNHEELKRECARALAEGFLVMIQEFISGPEEENVNYNSYAINSEVAVDFIAQKIRLCPPESGVPCVVRSCEVPQVRHFAAKMLAGLGYAGYSCMEFKRDPRDGEYKLLEVNGRYNRSISLSLRCGINFPHLNYDHLVHGRVPRAKSTLSGIYWIDISKDLFSWGHYLRQGGVCPSTLLAPYFGPHVFSDLSLSDIRPFVRRVTNLTLRAVQNVLHRLKTIGGFAK